MFRPQEPHPVDDTIGMVVAVDLIDHSLNAGVNETTVQFNTIQKTRSAVSNYERTTAEENRQKTRSAVSNYERTTAEENQQAALAGYKKGKEWVSSTLPCTNCGLIDLQWGATSE
jgi:hypothetical protein